METFLLQTKTERSGNVGTLSIEDSAFESLEKDFQEVLQELMGDRYAQAEVLSMYAADSQNIWLLIPVDNACQTANNHPSNRLCIRKQNMFRLFEEN